MSVFLLYYKERKKREKTKTYSFVHIETIHWVIVLLKNNGNDDDKFVNMIFSWLSPKGASKYLYEPVRCYVHV